MVYWRGGCLTYDIACIGGSLFFKKIERIYFFTKKMRMISLQMGLYCTILVASTHQIAGQSLAF